MSPDTIYSQMLWCNSNILRDGKPWKPNQNTNQGMVYIADILTDKWALMPFHEVCEKYGNGMGWLEYRALCSSIPKTWIRTLQSVEIKPKLSRDNCVYDRLCSSVKPASLAYKLLCQQSSHMEKAFSVIHQKVQIGLKEYQEALLVLYKLTNIDKYRSFQYRLLTNAIFANN